MLAQVITVVVAWWAEGVESAGREQPAPEGSHPAGTGRFVELRCGDRRRRHPADRDAVDGELPDVECAIRVNLELDPASVDEAKPARSPRGTFRFDEAVDTDDLGEASDPLSQRRPQGTEYVSQETNSLRMPLLATQWRRQPSCRTSRRYSTGPKRCRFATGGIGRPRASSA